MEEQAPTTAGCVLTIAILLFTVYLTVALMQFRPRVFTSPEDWMEDSGER